MVLRASQNSFPNTPRNGDPFTQHSEFLKNMRLSVASRGIPSDAQEAIIQSRIEERPWFAWIDHTMDVADVFKRNRIVRAAHLLFIFYGH